MPLDTRCEAMEFLRALPKQIPVGKLLVHNNVSPSLRLGARGFRAWLATDPEGLEVCPCNWAAELGQHYRRKTPDPTGESAPSR